MVSRLPKWIELGALILAFVAGYINVVGLLGFEHQSVSHLSGTASQLGYSFLEDTFSDSLHLAGIILSFVIGAAISGFLLHGSTLKLGRHYDTALILEALFIGLAIVLLTDDSYYGHFAASAACGLQNALVTTYSGAIIRTTHLTGIFTDLGIMLGAIFRGQSFDRRKAILFLIIIFGFVVGGTLGAYVFALTRFNALLLPCIICVLLAGAYRLLTRD